MCVGILADSAFIAPDLYANLGGVSPLWWNHAESPIIEVRSEGHCIRARRKLRTKLLISAGQRNGKYKSRADSRSESDYKKRQTDGPHKKPNRIFPAHKKPSH